MKRRCGVHPPRLSFLNRISNHKLQHDFCFDNLNGYQTHGLTFAQMPVAWKIATVYFAILNTIDVIGLWKGTWWGIVCFLMAAVSQVVL
jgi:hypothetical protein